MPALPSAHRSTRRRFAFGRALVAATLALHVAGAAAQGTAQGTTLVNRCEARGQVVFQQAPCPPGHAASQVQVAPTNVVASPPRPAPAAAASAASAPAAVAASAAAAVPTEADTCLAYLRPLLRDPTSGRILSSKRDGRVLQVQLQAADARGRLHTREAACEFVNGRVDDGWSRIQLERLGWFAPRVLVVGNNREARRAARALEESIEAVPGER
jgi:hypothetical protein